MANHYASLAELDEVDFQHLDYGLLSTSTTQGSYSAAVQNIFARHSAEVRGQTEPVVAPLHQVAKRRIRELIAKQNNETFQFLAHPERSPNILGIAETIFRKYGRDVPVLNRPIGRELNLDSSMNPVILEIEAGLLKLTADVSGNETQPLSVLMNQLKWVFNQYKVIGEEVMRLETLLSQKTESLDKLQQRQNIIMTLMPNDALPPLLDAYHEYVRETFESTRIESTYKDLIQAYKMWNILREVISLQQISRDMKEPLCSICLADPVSHTIAPCGHTFCTQCIRRVNTQCYLCRGPVRERIKLFFT